MAKPSLARSSVPTAKSVTPTLQQKLNSELDAAHLATERLQTLLNMVIESLYRRGLDDDHGLAICLENAVEVELSPARDRIHTALALVPEVANHG